MAVKRRRAVARALAAAMLVCCAHAGAADPAKVLRIALPRAETGFDPAQASEIYSASIIAAIMEPLLTFDYLARPAKLAPLTADALPNVAQGGKRFTFKLRKGIYFAADPAFKGRRRELVAADYAYAIKRLVDPRNRCAIGRPRLTPAGESRDEHRELRGACSMRAPEPPGDIRHNGSNTSAVKPSAAG